MRAGRRHWAAVGVMIALVSCRSPVEAPPFAPTPRVQQPPAQIEVGASPARSNERLPWVEEASAAAQLLQQALRPDEGSPDRSSLVACLKRMPAAAELRPGTELVQAMQEWVAAGTGTLEPALIAGWQDQANTLEPYCPYASWAVELLEKAQECVERGAPEQAVFEVQRAMPLLQSAPLEVACGPALQAVDRALIALAEAPEQVGTGTTAARACEEVLQRWNRFVAVAWILEGRSRVLAAQELAEGLAW